MKLTLDHVSSLFLHLELAFRAAVSRGDMRSLFHIRMMNGTYNHIFWWSFASYHSHRINHSPVYEAASPYIVDTIETKEEQNCRSASDNDTFYSSCPIKRLAPLLVMSHNSISFWHDVCFIESLAVNSASRHTYAQWYSRYIIALFETLLCKRHDYLLSCVLI